MLRLICLVKLLKFLLDFVCVFRICCIEIFSLKISDLLNDSFVDFKTQTDPSINKKYLTYVYIPVNY